MSPCSVTVRPMKGWTDEDGEVPDGYGWFCTCGQSAGPMSTVGGAEICGMNHLDHGPLLSPEVIALIGDLMLDPNEEES